MSVSFDSKEGHADALAFLTKQKATFANYRYDAEDWSDRFNIKGPPAVLVYGRDGKLARKFDHDDPDKSFEYSDVEKLVKELLAKK